MTEAEVAAKREALREARAEEADLSRKVSRLERQLLEATRATEGDAYRTDGLVFYDAIMTIRNFKDVYCPEEGWRVRCREGFDLTTPTKGVRVIPLGPFNNGKTWLLSQLCGADLPRGTSVHTEGLSIKVTAKSGHHAVLLDTVGANSPLGSVNLLPPLGEAPAQLSAETVQGLLEELRRQEDFYRQVAFQVASVILLVVGAMSHKDQTDLVRLSVAMRKDPERKNIVVVHNLREWSRAQLLEVGEDGRNYVQRNRDIFGLQDESLVVTLGAGERSVIRHKGLFTAEQGGRKCPPVQVTHYYLTNDNLGCNENAWAIEDIRTILTTSRTVDRPLSQELARAATKIQNSFIRLAESEPAIVFDAAHQRFVADRHIAHVNVVSRSWGTYFSMVDDEVLFNVTTLTFTANIDEDNEADDDDDDDDDWKTKTRWAYLVQLELPGLSATSLAAIKLASQARGPDALLKRESLDQDPTRSAVVRFNAKVFDVPEGFNAALKSSVARLYQRSHRDLSIGTDPSQYKEHNEGTRARCDRGERSTQVAVWTGVSDWQSGKHPFVTYVDGVLTFVLLANEQPKPRG